MQTAGYARLFLAATLFVMTNARASLAQGGVKCDANPSILSLIVAPERFEGKSICTVGVARVEYEGFRIYVTEEDAERRIAENSIRFDPSDSVVPVAGMKKLDMEYVQIGGNLVLEPHVDESGARVGVIRKLTMFRAR